MKQTFAEFWHFLKAPSFLQLKSDQKNVWRDFKWLLLLDILVAIVLMSIYELLLNFNWIKEYKGVDFLKEYGIFWSFIFICIFAPISEELVFRWHLRKRYASIYFFLLTATVIIISTIENSLVASLIFIAALILAYVLHHQLRNQSQTLKQNLWKKSYPIIFYASALMFGLIHLSNFEGLSFADPSFVFYVGSQTFGALSLGYLCVKYGLKYSILFHACFNLFAFIAELISANS